MTQRPPPRLFSELTELGAAVEPELELLPRRPIAVRGESKPFCRPIERKWVRAPCQSPEEAGRGSQRSGPRAASDAAPAAGAGGVPGEPARAGSYCSQPSSILQRRERGGAGIHSTNRESGEVVPGQD